MQDLVINSTVQLTLLLFVPLFFAYILKQTRIRSWAMLGGVLGGVLLGPAVFGSISHDYWEDIFQGGANEHEIVFRLERQQQADLLAATTLGVDEVILMQMHKIIRMNPVATGKIKWVQVFKTVEETDVA